MSNTFEGQLKLLEFGDVNGFDFAYLRSRDGVPAVMFREGKFYGNRYFFDTCWYEEEQERLKVVEHYREHGYPKPGKLRRQRGYILPKPYADKPLNRFADLTYNQKNVMQVAWNDHGWITRGYPEYVEMQDSCTKFDYSNSPELVALFEQGLIHLLYPVKLYVGSGLRLDEKGILMMQTWEDEGRPGENKPRY
jgi:hypothetical protein